MKNISYQNLPLFMNEKITRDILGKAIGAIPSKTKVYLVGGSVRNAFYYHFFKKKLPQRDYDLLLIGNKNQFIRNLRKSGFTYGRIRRKYEVVLKKKRVAKPQDWYQDHLFFDIHLSPEKSVLANLKKYATFTMNGFALPLPAVTSPRWRQQVLSLPTAIPDLKKKQLRVNAARLEPTTIFAALRFVSVGFKAPSASDLQHLLSALGKVEKRRFKRAVDKLFRYVGGERRARRLARKMGIQPDIFDFAVGRRLQFPN